jgi:hypothetical protein
VKLPDDLAATAANGRDAAPATPASATATPPDKPLLDATRRLLPLSDDRGRPRKAATAVGRAAQPQEGGYEFVFLESLFLHQITRPKLVEQLREHQIWSAQSYSAALAVFSPNPHISSRSGSHRPAAI